MKFNMKLIFLSTSILLALASPIRAEMKFEVEGKLTFGVNNRLDNSSYLIGEVEFYTDQEFDSGFGLALSSELEGENFGWGTTKYDDASLLDFITPIGVLSYGDIEEKGASELFYNDLDGMAFGVAGYEDRYASLRWHGDIGDHFSYAVSDRNMSNNDDEYSFGAGYETDRFEFGLAYDSDAEDQQKEAWAITAVYNGTLGSAYAEYTLSYIDVDENSAFGLGVESELANGLAVEVSYAFNNATGIDNGYGLALEYEAGSLSAEAFYEYDSEEGVELAYSIDSLAPEGTVFYAGYAQEEGNTKDTGYYVGVGFGIKEHAILGIAYSQTDNAGGLEVQSGISAMLTVSF